MTTEMVESTVFSSLADIQTGDFREILEKLDSGSADLVLTDPPYTISRETGFANLGNNSIKRFAVSMDFGEWDHAPIDLDILSNSIYRVLRNGGTAIVWYDIWKLSHLSEALTRAGFKMLRL